MIERHAPVTSVPPGLPGAQEQPPRIIQPSLDSQKAAPLPPKPSGAAVLPERPLTRISAIGEQGSRDRELRAAPPKSVLVASSGKDAGTPAAGKPADASPPHIQVGEIQLLAPKSYDSDTPSETEPGGGEEKIVVTEEGLSHTPPADTGGSGKGGDRNIPRPPGGEGPDDSGPGDRGDKEKGSRKKETESTAHIINIDISESKTVVIPPNDTSNYLIKTVSRTGCDAILVWKKAPNGKHEIFMTHYPPDEHDEQIRDIQQSSPRGEGTIRAVYLTYEAEETGRILETTAQIERITGIRPTIVHLSESDIPDTLKTEEEMQLNPLLYQMVVFIGREGNSQINRIRIPTKNGNAYIETF